MKRKPREIQKTYLVSFVVRITCLLE